MARFSTVLLFAVLVASCDTNFTQGFSDLLSIRNEVVKVVDAGNVSVNINNGSTLTINITNSSVNERPSQSRKLVADRVARIAYEGYTDRQKLEVVYVVFSSYEKKFAVVEVTSTVESFQYLPKEIGKLTVGFNVASPRQPGGMAVSQSP